MFIFVNCFLSREHTASVAGLASWTVTVHGGVVASGSGVGVVSGESAWRARRVEMMVEQVDSSSVRYEVDEVAICGHQRQNSVECRDLDTKVGVTDGFGGDVRGLDE